MCRLPRWRSGKESACQCRRHKRQGLNPWVRKIPWRRKRQPALVFLPGKAHGQKSLVGYCAWGHKQLDVTEHTRLHPNLYGGQAEGDLRHTQGRSRVKREVGIGWRSQTKDHLKPLQGAWSCQHLEFRLLGSWRWGSERLLLLATRFVMNHYRSPRDTHARTWFISSSLLIKTRVRIVQSWGISCCHLEMFVEPPRLIWNKMRNWGHVCGRVDGGHPSRVWALNVGGVHSQKDPRSRWWTFSSTWTFTRQFSLSLSFTNFTERVSFWAQRNQLFLTDEWAFFFFFFFFKKKAHFPHLPFLLDSASSDLWPDTSVACTLALWPPSTTLEASPVLPASPVISYPNRNDNEQLPRGRQPVRLCVLRQGSYYCQICRWSKLGTERLGKPPQVNQLVVKQNPQRKS